MELSPEERRKIYEEEKARIEAREQLEQERRRMSPEASVNLAPNITGVLCYLGIWITGIIFFILEQKNKWVRFHAAQSIVVFGTLGIASAILHWIPIIGWFFTGVIWITGIVLWVVLMSKAYNGERYKIPWAGDIAEMMVGISIKIPDYPKPPPPPESREMPFTPPPPPPPRSDAADIDERIDKKVQDFFKHKREGRITASAFAIAWSIILLVVFNFFHQYIAYYTYNAASSTWTWDSFFTSDIGLWLPILNTALAISIIGNIVLIIINSNIVRQSIHVIINGFGLASVMTLLVVFPFDFDVISNSTAAASTTLGVRIALICIAVGFGIALLVRIIKLLVSIIKTAIKLPDGD
jgi:uncharacterized membrane protein